MILQDEDGNPSHFIIVRRWESPEVVANWAQEQHRHAGELMALVPDRGRPTVLTQVGDLGRGGTQTG